MLPCPLGNMYVVVGGLTHCDVSCEIYVSFAAVLAGSNSSAA